MKKFIWICALATLIVLAGKNPGLADEELALDLFRPRIKVTLQQMPQRDFRDAPGEFGYRSAEMDAVIPIGKSIIGFREGALLRQLLARVRFNVSEPEISFLPRDHTLYSGNAGLAGLIVLDRKNTFLLYGGGSFAEDDETIKDLSPRLSLLAAGLRRTNSPVSWIYGAGFSYLFGRGVLYPVLGLTARLGEDWTLAVLLPFLVKGSYRVNQDLRVGCLLGLTGDKYRFANEDVYPGQPDVLELKMFQVKLGLDADYKISKNMSLFGELGVLGGRRLTLSGDDDDLFASDIEPCGYAKVGIKFSWGRSYLDTLMDKNYQ